MFQIFTNANSVITANCGSLHSSDSGYFGRMITLRQVVPTDDDVVQLIYALNDYQINLYGVENCNLESPAQLVKHNAYMIGAFSEKELVGIGAVKIIDTYAEVKRMFVKETFRGRAIANRILIELEMHVQRNGIFSVCLETGNLHHEAIAFYTRNGYQPVEFFGIYKPNAVSIYFSKQFPRPA